LQFLKLKLRIPEQHFQAVYSDEFWPYPIKISRWSFRCPLCANFAEYLRLFRQLLPPRSKLFYMNCSSSFHRFLLCDIRSRHSNSNLHAFYSSSRSRCTVKEFGQCSLALDAIQLQHLQFLA